ncbi:hypothetical protein BU15DRAFT_61486 [Melanogaster broomeanus]|nr:hypothetical protein BU15DRAFT_61486 [Melanogaster broomeanus]
MHRSAQRSGSGSDNNGNGNNYNNTNRLQPSPQRLRRSPKKAALKLSVTSRKIEQRTDTEDVFTCGLLTPPSSQIMEDDSDTLPRRATKSPHTSPFGMMPRSRAHGHSPSTSHLSVQAPKRKRNSIFPSASTRDIINSTLNDITQTATGLSTPNPKPRKHLKHQYNLQIGLSHIDQLVPAPAPRLWSAPPALSSACICRSPTKRTPWIPSHANNVDADYYPPNKCSSRKCRMRARSTTPAYEPPSERFTPPREIEMTPLACGTPRAPKSLIHNTSSRANGNIFCRRQARTTRARLCGGRIDDLGSTDDIDALPVFNFAHPADETNDGWSDSEDEFNLTGEFTGRYKMLTIPTKADPPTSGMRERMALWGRPVSPFPYSEIMERSLSLSGLTEEGDNALLDDCGKHDASRDADSLPPSDAPEPWDLATEPPPSDEAWLSSSDFAEYDEGLPEFDAAPAAAESTEVRPLIPLPERRSDLDQTVLLQEEEEEEEAEVDRELSVPVDDGLNSSLTLPKSTLLSEDSSSDNDEDVEGDIVKITSGDAVAAARAAAILRMVAARSRRSSCSVKSSTRKRRTTIGNAGITKRHRDPKQQRRQTIHGSEISPLSRGAPLLELWRKVEDSIFLDHHMPGKVHCDALLASSSSKASTSQLVSVLAPLSGEWTREDWKRMDKCLVTERLVVAAASGRALLSEIEDISKDAVLERFIAQVGGDPVLLGLGPEWSRANLIMRLDALIKKQLRFAAKARSFHRQESNTSLDSTVPRYRDFLQEALATSPTEELLPTSFATVSDGSLSLSRQDPRSRSILEPLPCLESSWSSPSRPPEPSLQHPRDQVHLRHASLPKKSMIPVPVRPKRLVDLRHLSPRKLNRDGHVEILRPRWSSGSGVKDLVKRFEETI